MAPKYICCTSQLLHHQNDVTYKVSIIMLLVYTVELWQTVKIFAMLFYIVRIPKSVQSERGTMEEWRLSLSLFIGRPFASIPSLSSECSSRPLSSHTQQQQWQPRFPLGFACLLLTLKKPNPWSDTTETFK